MDVPLHVEFHLCYIFHIQLDKLDIPSLGAAVRNYK